MIDGQLRFTAYTRDELLDALAHIDPVRYPTNFANAQSEYQARYPVQDQLVPAAVSSTAVIPAQLRMSVGPASAVHAIKRPILVWLISVTQCLGAAWSVLCMIAISLGVAGVTPAQKAYIDSLSLAHHAVAIAIMAVDLLGAIALFRLKRRALEYFAAALVLHMAFTLYLLVTKPFAAALGGPASVLFVMLFGWGYAFAVIFYTQRLIARRALT